MRDGVKLFTSVYVPKDAEHAPIMLMRTPYSVAPYGIDQYRETVGPSPHFGRAGYIVAYQDVRGRFMSEGQFVDVRPTKPEKKSPADIDESSDTFDTIDWLVKNIPGNNGRVGSWGISYPGFYAAATAVDSHPALKAASPQAPLVDWFLGDDVHHNGAFFLHQTFDFDAVFGVARPEPTSKVPARMGFDHGTPDAYDFFLRLGPLSNANKLHFKGERLLERGDGTPQLRQVLAGARPLAAPQANEARRDDRRRVVRRGRPVRAAQDVSLDPGPQPEVAEPARHGAMGPRRLEPRRRGEPRLRQIRIQDGRALSRTYRVRLLRAPPPSGDARKACTRVPSTRRSRRGPSRRAGTSGTATSPGPRPRRSRGRSTSAPAASSPSSRPRSPRTKASTSTRATPPTPCPTRAWSRPAIRRRSWSRTSDSPPAGPTS